MQKNKPKVVFTFVEAGFGHIMPATAISDAFEKKYGDVCEVIRWNIFSDNDNPIINKYCSDIFGWTKKVANNKFMFIGEKLSYLIGSKATLKVLDKKFKAAKVIITEEIKKVNPDLICSTYYSPSHFAIECKGQNGFNPIVATYTPDPIVYPAWDRRSDLYFVNNEQAYARALKSGFKKENLRIVPFVLRNNIKDVPLDKNLNRKNLGLKENKFTILLASGAYGTKKDKKVVDSFLKADLNANLVVICGKNKDLLDYCKSVKLSSESKTSFYPVGFTDRMFEYNCASDIFIGKSGANAMVESYYFGVPTIITSHANPLETEIAKFYIDRKGCGKQIFNTQKLIKYVKNYMQDSTLQEDFKIKLNAYHDASGAEKVADELFNELKKQGRI